MKSLILSMGIFCLIYTLSCGPVNESPNEYELMDHDSNPQVENELSKEPALMTTQVLTAMGGVTKWNNLKYVSWTFFGSRHLIWDKLNSRVRIENQRDSSVYLLDMKTNMGRYAHAGVELPDGPILQEKMTKAKSLWINDMYWLFMPFKLNDPGVTVRYLKEGKSNKNQNCSIFTLTFKDVGNTPENKYEIYVDHEDHLIKQWAFYEKADEDIAYATWPWDNYNSYKGLLLSADRSDQKGPSNVKVYDTLDDKVFSSLEPFEFY